ncbi:ElaB/YqjD/DUF883 family membrane-anchored ribosome-binding protein [Gordonia amarae]|uniref:Uncharacterized protein n=1 Tax=Gordonia amarae NBRC 15530 TaxID=1075090 RepID=G7GUQ5_9ACTN|nr:hypothetical protein [Gordonia amarae]MCS3876892.1 ElaB/YqjD/DUF883 family membrane-anchored ribosome-binding protein [Gordonia amarae]GAB07330.1 hypothetical protein GOAMR_64_00130 [Gordonia amarae NBRC 15530]
MAGNFVRRMFGGRSRERDAHLQHQLDALTTAFLDSERQLSQLDLAVSLAREINPNTRTAHDWQPLRDRQLQIVGEYLRLTATPDPDARDRPRPPAPVEITACIDAIGALSHDMNRFSQVHQGELTSASGAGSLAVSETHQAKVAAHESLSQLEHAPGGISRLRTVDQAARAVRDGMVRLEAAGGIPERRREAAAVLAAAQRLREVLADAATLPEQSDRVIRSVETRLSAIGHRATRVPEALSELLREFSSDCSKDLRDNQRRVDSHLADARADIEQARRHQRTDPDVAIGDAARARDHLDEAEREVDAVLDRLRTLRDVRADPAGHERKVRFRLRDAQQFAVNNSLVDDWGSVLDAQSDRIDRAKATLTRIHPDYWAYWTELRAVDGKITEIIDRMRGQLAAK